MTLSVSQFEFGIRAITHIAITLPVVAVLSTTALPTIWYGVLLFVLASGLGFAGGQAVAAYPTSGATRTTWLVVAAILVLWVASWYLPDPVLALVFRIAGTMAVTHNVAILLAGMGADAENQDRAFYRSASYWSGDPGAGLWRGARSVGYKVLTMAATLAFLFAFPSLLGTPEEGGVSFLYPLLGFSVALLAVTPLNSWPPARRHLAHLVSALAFFLVSQWCFSFVEGIAGALFSFACVVNSLILLYTGHRTRQRYEAKAAEWAKSNGPDPDQKEMSE